MNGERTIDWLRRELPHFRWRYLRARTYGATGITRYAKYEVGWVTDARGVRELRWLDTLDLVRQSRRRNAQTWPARNVPPQPRP